MLVQPQTDGCKEAIRAATALGDQRSGDTDLEFPIRQPVEVAVRALSPPINDPHTFMTAWLTFARHFNATVLDELQQAFETPEQPRQALETLPPVNV